MPAPLTTEATSTDIDTINNKDVRLFRIFRWLPPLVSPIVGAAFLDQESFAPFIHEEVSTPQNELLNKLHVWPATNGTYYDINTAWWDSVLRQPLLGYALGVIAVLFFRHINCIYDGNKLLANEVKKMTVFSNPSHIDFISWGVALTSIETLAGGLGTYKPSIEKLSAVGYNAVGALITSTFLVLTIKAYQFTAPKISYCLSRSQTAPATDTETSGRTLRFSSNERETRNNAVTEPLLDTRTAEEAAVRAEHAVLAP